MTTISKLQQEGREEFEKKYGWYLQSVVYCPKGIFGKESAKKTTTFDKDIKAFLTAQIKKAYLTALSDVEKGLPTEDDMRPEITEWLVSKDYSKGRNSMLNEVQEVIKSLREPNGK